MMVFERNRDFSTVEPDCIAVGGSDYSLFAD